MHEADEKNINIDLTMARITCEDCNCIVMDVPMKCFSCFANKFEKYKMNNMQRFFYELKMFSIDNILLFALWVSTGMIFGLSYELTLICGCLAYHANKLLGSWLKKII